jgi:hypothetical protein
MRDAMSCLRPARRAWAVLALGLLLSTPGCTELTAPVEPELTGPADQGFNVELRALPDTVNADGISFSRVRLVLRNQNGQPVQGYAVLFECDGSDRFCNGDGTLMPDPSSTYVGPIQTGEVMATNSEGIAQMVYTAGTAFRVVTITVRPYNYDGVIEYNWAFRSVTIIQR